MPPRYVYWTIIVDGQPTAFRSGSLEDIMPTFNRVKEKQPSAELKWFQYGQLWPSRHDAQDFMRARGDRGRERDPRQNTGDASSAKASSFAKATEDKPEGRPERAWNAKPEWKTRSTFAPRKEVGSGFSRSEKPAGKPEWKPKEPFTPSGDKPVGKPEWKPKGTFEPKEPGHKSGGDKPAWKPKGSSSPKPQASSAWSDRDDRPAGQARGSKPPEWKPKGTFKPKEAGHASGWGEKPGWKPKSPEGRAPKGSAREQARSSFRPKSYSPRPDDGMTRSSRVQSRNDKLEWKPASAKASRPAPERRHDGPNAGFKKSDTGDAPKRKWVPKAEYKKSLGIEAKRDDKWRPGGEHKDPKQKYKDAKKAKWTRVKATIRARSSRPRKPKDE